MEPLSRMECMKLLISCMDLFQPENWGLYGRYLPNGNFVKEMAEPDRIPAGFPGNHQELDELTGRIYEGMLRLKMPEQYMSYPRFEEMHRRLDGLRFEECAQFLLYWARANLRGGWEFFYQTWQEGTALAVFRRMVSQLDTYRFEEERPVHKEPAVIELMLGDITAAAVNAVVNPTDVHFSGSGGVDKFLHQKAGGQLREACKKIGHLPAGQAVATSGFDLPAGIVIHVSVPGKKTEEAPYLLAACYANALFLARSRGERTVAFPAMGSGSAGIPPEEALRIGAQTLWNWTRQNPGEPMTVKVLFTSEKKLEYFRKALMLCIVREFRAMADPANMGAALRHSLPYLLEECGGFVALPPEKRCHADLGREALSTMHREYSERMLLLHRLIGRPEYGSVVQNAVRRVCSQGGCELVKVFVEHLEQMRLEECICYLVLLQRMDYGSGGTSLTHIRNCANGNVLRVLDRLERLLRA